MNKKLIELLTKTQEGLMVLLPYKLKSYGYTNIILTPYSIYAEGGGNTPCLVAHLDTINTHRSRGLSLDSSDNTPTKSDIEFSADGNLCKLSSKANPNLSCLGADDRVGVFSILEMLERGHKPHVLFTTDEEIGCVGTEKFIENYSKTPCYIKDATMFIQVDRGVHEGSWNEMVFYDYDEHSIPEIYEELSKYYVMAQGSFTDVALLGEYFNKPLVNLSASYKNEHTRDEYIRLDILNHNINSLDNMLIWLGNQDSKHWEFTSKYNNYVEDYTDDFSDPSLSDIEYLYMVSPLVDNNVNYFEEYVKTLSSVERVYVSIYLREAFIKGEKAESLQELDRILKGLF